MIGYTGGQTYRYQCACGRWTRTNYVCETPPPCYRCVVERAKRRKRT